MSSSQLAVFLLNLTIYTAPVYWLTFLMLGLTGAYAVLFSRLGKFPPHGAEDELPSERAPRPESALGDVDSAGK